MTLEFKAGYAADLLFIVALGFSKISTCLFYEALFSQLPRRIIRTILAATITWIVIALFLVAIRCRDDPWHDISARCGSLVRVRRLVLIYPSIYWDRSNRGCSSLTGKP